MVAMKEKKPIPLVMELIESDSTEIQWLPFMFGSIEQMKLVDGLLTCETHSEFFRSSHNRMQLMHSADEGLSC